jgi:hypothetical protein
MPALRAHLVFLSDVADALPVAHHEAGAVTRAYWPAALLGALAPDVWYVSGGKRSDWHELEKGDPSTWEGAIERWLEGRPSLRPGRRLPPETAGFMVGYLAHLGLDTWVQYQEAALPEAVRQDAFSGWFPEALRARGRLPAALRALAERPFPPERRVTRAQVEASAIPDGFPAADIRHLLLSLLPALETDDPWEMSRHHPWRELPRSEEARREWDAQRAGRVLASAAEAGALSDSALDFTFTALGRWW